MLDRLERRPIRSVKSAAQLTAEAAQRGSLIHEFLLEPVSFAQNWQWRLDDEDLPSSARPLADTTFAMLAMIELRLQKAGWLPELRACECEHTLLWREPRFGLTLRCRPDAYRLDTATLYEIKTVEKADIDAQRALSANRRLALQVEMQTEALKSLTGITVRPKLLLIGSVWPYSCQLIDIPPATRQLGQALLEEALQVTAAEAAKRAG